MTIPEDDSELVEHYGPCCKEGTCDVDHVGGFVQVGVSGWFSKWRCSDDCPHPSHEEHPA